MAGTTLYLAKKKYCDLLVAAGTMLEEDGATSLVHFGIPPNPRREFVAIGGTVEADQEFATMRAGGASRDEVFAFVLVAATEIPGKTQEEATLRAVTLFAAAELVIRSNTAPAISAGRIQAAEVRRLSLDEYGTDEGFCAAVSAALHVRARI